MDKPEIERTVAEIVSNKLDVEIDRVRLDSDLAIDLGMSSMDAIELVFEIEDRFNIEVPEEKLANIRRVKDLVELLSAETAEKR